MSWASQLHSRVGNGEGAELLLELWRRVFTNEGRGSMRDAVMNGVTLMGAPPLLPQASAARVDAKTDAAAAEAAALVGACLVRADAGTQRVRDLGMVERDQPMACGGACDARRADSSAPTRRGVRVGVGGSRRHRDRHADSEDGRRRTGDDQIAAVIPPST